MKLFLDGKHSFLIYKIKKEFMSYKRIIGIYKIKNLINNKVYIGSSISIMERFSTHKRSLIKNIHFNKHLQSSFNKYGISNFKFEILEDLKFIDKNLLREREEFNIKFYKSNNNEYGYNKRIVCDTNLGMKFSDEHRENLRISHIGNKRSKEANLKIIESQYKRIFQISENGIILNEFKSIKDAEEITNISRQSISACCRNALNSSGGFYWSFIESYNPNKDYKKIKKSSKNIKYIYKNTITGDIFFKLKDVCKSINIKNTTLLMMLNGSNKNRTNIIRYEKH